MDLKDLNRESSFSAFSALFSIQATGGAVPERIPQKRIRCPEGVNEGAGKKAAAFSRFLREP